MGAKMYKYAFDAGIWVCVLACPATVAARCMTKVNRAAVSKPTYFLDRWNFC